MGFELSLSLCLFIGAGLISMDGISISSGLMIFCGYPCGEFVGWMDIDYEEVRQADE